MTTAAELEQAILTLRRYRAFLLGALEMAANDHTLAETDAIQSALRTLGILSDGSPEPIPVLARRETVAAARSVSVSQPTLNAFEVEDATGEEEVDTELGEIVSEAQAREKWNSFGRKQDSRRSWMRQAKFNEVFATRSAMAAKHSFDSLDQIERRLVRRAVWLEMWA